MKFKIGDIVIGVKNDRGMNLVQVGRIYKIEINDAKRNFISAMKYKKTEVGFICNQGIEWVCTDHLNIPKQCLRPLTKLEKALR